MVKGRGALLSREYFKPPRSIQPHQGFLLSPLDMKLEFLRFLLTPHLQKEKGDSCFRNFLFINSALEYFKSLTIQIGQQCKQTIMTNIPFCWTERSVLLLFLASLFGRPLTNESGSLHFITLVGPEVKSLKAV